MSDFHNVSYVQDKQYACHIHTQHNRLENLMKNTFIKTKLGVETAETKILQIKTSYV